MSRATAGSRAVLRLARRDAWRNRGRSALIALMVALPVLSISVVSVIYQSSQREGRDWVSVRLGSSSDVQAWIGESGTAPIAQTADGSAYHQSGDQGATALDEQHSQAQVSAQLPAGDRLLVDRYRDGSGAIRLRGRTVSVGLRVFDYTDPDLRGLIRQQSGRAPRAPDEVVASARLARSWRLHPGDALGLRTATGAEVRLNVVGVVGGTSLIGDPVLIGLPGSLLIPAPVSSGRPVPPTERAVSSWLVIGPAPVEWTRISRLNTAGFVVTSRSVVADPPPVGEVQYNYTAVNGSESRLGVDTGLPSASAAGVLIVGIGLILLQIALLAGPAIAVGARRNERTLALIAAAGGNRRQLRSVVLATSGVIGLLGCTVAALLGAGLGALAIPLLRRYDNQQLVRVDVHPLDLLVLVAVGSLTAAAAAMVPSRQAARMDVVAVLTGRRLHPRPPHRVLVVGVLITLIGCGVCYFAAIAIMPFSTVFGIAVAEVGLVTVTGSIIALAARTAPRLPFAARFALRDAARQRGRTAPAVAAVMAAIAGSVAVGVYLTSNNAENQRDFRPVTAVGAVDVQLFPGMSSKAGAEPTLDPIPVGTAQTAAAALRRTLPVRQLAVYQSIMDGGHDLSLLASPGRPTRDSTGLGDPQLFGTFDPMATGFFDDGSALRIRIGTADPAATAALRAGRVVLYDPRWWWPDGTVHVRVEAPDADADPVRIVRLPATLLTSRPGLAYPVFPPSAARSLRVRISPAGIAAAGDGVPSAARQRALATAVRGVVDSRVLVRVRVQAPFRNSFPVSLLALVAAAAVITLGGTFTAVGLAAAEGRADVATLASVGAGPGVRRRLAAAQAAVITVLGSGLGLLTGLLAGWALVRLHGAPQHYAGGFSTALRTRYGSGWPFEVPWATVSLLVVGVPLLAIVIGFAVTRSRLPLIRRLGQ